eukprot:TRINITY_DN5349_c0_g1_i2.p1 TRINITY_DN5349_c0_g1~~TRINITY_DN5349_c0_g1_i2.p1  ORF type:complete len:393 (-),score=46.69 TRINITY_DN5349_c0_g1_i2:97-1275(-)
MVKYPQNYVFVTVGSTNFDALIKVIDDPQFHTILQDFGYGGVLMQIGDGEYNPKYSRLVEPEELVLSKEKTKSFESLYYRYRKGIQQDIDNAGLVISHAGSGSIVETLEAGKPLVVVINDMLMHNHQEELANRLVQDQYLLVSTPQTLTSVIEQELKSYLENRVIVCENKNAVGEISEYINTIVQKGKRNPISKTNTMIVIGSGGHTFEMMRILDGMSMSNFTPRAYVLAETDKMGESKIVDKEGPPGKKPYTVSRIPRSRHVGQSYFTSIFTTLVSLYYCLFLVWHYCPDLVLCNGPGTCIPIVFAAWFFSLIRPGYRCNIVYIESVARVRGLSLSGLIAKYLATGFVVQWPSLSQVRKDVKVCNLFFPISESSSAQEVKGKGKGKGAKSR